MMSKHKHPILIGCCTWSFPDWEGVLYPDGMKPGEFLEYYADRFPIVEADSTFYGVPTPRAVRSWKTRTPTDFKFTAKVPKAITHTKRLQDCKAEVQEFVSSILYLEDKLAAALLQLGYFNKGAFGSLEAFLDVLGPFLAEWPHERVPLAVEVRNPK